jgi:hypothetical protein
MKAKMKRRRKEKIASFSSAGDSWRNQHVKMYEGILQLSE